MNVPSIVIVTILSFAILGVWIYIIYLFVNLAQQKGVENTAGLWLIGIFASPIALGLYVVAVPDKSTPTGLPVTYTQVLTQGAAAPMLLPEEQERQKAAQKAKKTKKYGIITIIITLLVVGIIIGTYSAVQSAEAAAEVAAEYAAEAAVKAKLNLINKPGDTLTFGTYASKPITWQVLAVENGRAFIISKDVLDTKPYNDKKTNITWEKCSLRNWLNGDFLNNSFSQAEKAKIADTKLVNANNPFFYNSLGGNDTTDKVFLLSTDEVQKYFASDSAMVAKLLNSTNSAATRYVGKAYGWWLRSPGSSANYAVSANDDGLVSDYGDDVYSVDGGVRPALWLNL